MFKKMLCVTSFLVFSVCTGQQEPGKAFKQAVEDGKTEVVKTLVLQNKITAGSILNSHNKQTALMFVAEKGKKNIVELLLQKPSSQGIEKDINQEDIFGNTALTLAFQTKHDDNARMILQKRPFKESELVLLTRTKNADFVSFVINNQEGISAQTKYALLKNSIEYENTDISETLLADEEVRALSKKENEQNFQRALAQGDSDTFDQMLEKDVNLSHVDDSGNTVLMQALKSGNNDFVKKLLKKGVIVDAQDESGKTALIKALEQGNLEAARMLLKHGADSFIQDTTGKSAFARAIEKGYNDIALEIVQQKKEEPELMQLQEQEEGLESAEKDVALMALARDPEQEKPAQDEENVLVQEKRAQQVEGIQNKAREGIATLARFKSEAQKSMHLYPWAKKEYAPVMQELERLHNDLVFLITTARSEQALQEVESFNIRVNTIKQKIDHMFDVIKRLNNKNQQIKESRQRGKTYVPVAQEVQEPRATQERILEREQVEREQKRLADEQQQRQKLTPQVIVLVKRIKQKINTMLDIIKNIEQRIHEALAKYPDLEAKLNMQKEIVKKEKEKMLKIYSDNKIKKAQQVYDIGVLQDIYQKVEQSENEIYKSSRIIESIIEDAEPGFFAQLRGYFNL